MADKVEDRAFELITRFQPVATDLRTIKSYMKIGYDFSRYGRYALDISYINDQINGLAECSVDIKKSVEKMSEKTLQMVKISIDALRKHDIDLAKTIEKIEQEVDEMYLKHLKKLLAEKNATPQSIISSALMIRYLERIADHAVYVCESILYIVTGEKNQNAITTKTPFKTTTHILPKQQLFLHKNNNTQHTIRPNTRCY
jgi:phosphate transport system protein